MIIRGGKETISQSEKYHGISKLIGEKNDEESEQEAKWQ